MSTYRERREARADRLRDWSEKRAQKAEAASARAHDLASVIPFGQPILVGHHSEGRDRRYRARIGSTMDRAVEHDRKARSMAAKADNIERATAHAIYSDDVDAVERLAERIEALEGERDRIKRYNASCRKGARDLSILDDRQRADLMSAAKHSAYSIGKKGEMPAYHLANLSGQISTKRKRLAQLQRDRERAQARTCNLCDVEVEDAADLNAHGECVECVDHAEGSSGF